MKRRVRWKFSALQQHKCPKCGAPGWRSRVHYVVHMDSGPTRRARICEVCYHAYSTFEFLSPQQPEPDSAVPPPEDVKE